MRAVVSGRGGLRVGGRECAGGDGWRGRRERRLWSGRDGPWAGGESVTGGKGKEIREGDGDDKQGLIRTGSGWEDHSKASEGLPWENARLRSKATRAR